MFMINFNLKLIILIRLKLTLSLYKQYKNELFRKKNLTYMLPINI